MLLADQADGHDPPGLERQRRTEEELKHEDALRMVTQSAMKKIDENRLRLVELLVQRQVVFRRAAPFADRRESVMVETFHDSLRTRTP